MIVLRNKNFSDKKKKEKGYKNLKWDALAATGAGLTGYGINSLVKNSDDVLGLETFYHNTEDIKGVREGGIKSSFAERKDNLTNKILNDLSPDEVKGKVYLAKTEKLADDVGKSRMSQGIKGDNLTVKVKIPVEDLKKMKIVNNPELGDSKSFEEYLPKYRNRAYQSLINKGFSPDTAKEASENFISDAIAKANYDALQDSVTIEGDVDRKYIKGSDHYKPQTIKGVFKYAKNNPKRFLKAAGKGIAGITLGTGATIVGLSNFNKKQKDDSTKK